MAAFNKFNVFLGDLGAKKHDLTADALKIMLTDAAPAATNTVKANIAEIATGNGYATGGNAAGFVSWTQVAGLWKLILSPVQFTAAGGNFAQFRHAVLYNSTAAGGPLIGWWDYAAEINLTNGNSFTVQLDPANGVFTNG
jgi:hypothetical protein